MKFNSIKHHEDTFFYTKKALNGKVFNIQKKSIPGLDYLKCRPVEYVDYFYEDKHEKTSAVIHFTEGFLKSDLYYLTHMGHISVPFVIARSGDILNLHSSSAWSYHLGKKARGGNTYMSQRTIGIEMSNIGALTRRGDELYNRYGTVYCHINDQEQYHQFEEPFRGKYYFATHTDAQYEALAMLLKYLRDYKGIQLNFLPMEKRYTTLTTEEIIAYRGVLTHINFRDDLDENGDYKKIDIGKGFQWDRLEESLKS